MLQYDLTANLRGLLGTSGKGDDTATASGLERAVLTALQNRSSKELIALFQSPVDSRFLLADERMTDADRVRYAKVRSPREQLERFMVLRYPTVAAAQAAAKAMAKEPMIASAKGTAKVVESVFTPNDPYFSPVGNASTYPKSYYQWGLHAMNFPTAWDKARGQAHVGVMDAAYFGRILTNASNVKYVNPHPDLTQNSRLHFTPGTITSEIPSSHTIHVAGIIAAQANNLGVNTPVYGGTPFNGGTSGGCLDCSITAFSYTGNSYRAPGSNETAAVVAALTRALDTGMQIINWSGELSKNSPTGQNCPDWGDAFCVVLDYITQREVLLPVSAGNFSRASADLAPPLKYSAYYSILPVGGTEIDNPQIGVTGSRWYYGWGPCDDGVGTCNHGSSEATMDGVLAPAKSIVSSFLNSAVHNFRPHAMCGDGYSGAIAVDESSGRFANGYGDSVGSCTGTSMSAPHISALAGLIRSVNPLLSAIQTRSIIQNTGNLYATRTTAMGYGLPNASTAVSAAVSTNPRKLTPLFSFYSPERLDSFYTTVPQMGIAALMGTLMPRKNMGNGAFTGSDGYYYSAYGNNLNMYPYFPTLDFVMGGDSTPRAEVWLFTTHNNPKNEAARLTPVYRMSWKCGDSTPVPPAICNAPNQRHIDTVLLAESEVDYFKSRGFKVDGLEGYVYPKNLPQPAGTVRLLRKYNSARDDHAIFPETALTTMQAQGYTIDTNLTDWLGYVYPNTNGNMPLIQ